MKLYGHGIAFAVALASPANALSEDWFGDVMTQTFPDVQSVMSVVLTKPDPCEVAVASLIKSDKQADMFDELFESLFPMRACSGQLMFSQAEEEECMAIQSSPAVEDMLAHGITSPPLVCTWRQFWVEAAASNDHAAPFDSCELCERTVTMIENTFDKQELAIEVVEQALKLLCEYLPSSSKCSVLVTRLDDIIKWLKDGLSPKHICQKISMCTAALARPDAGSAKALSSLRASPQHDELCAICQDNTNAMHSLVNVPHGLKLYKDGLDAVCAHTADSKACQFMSSHFHVLAKHLEQGDDVLATCQKVRACVTETAVAAATPTFLGCVYCEFVGQVVTSALHQGGKDTLPAVKDGLDGLCINLPPQAQCKVMDLRFDDLTNMMDQGKTPREGCEAVQMCSPLEAAAAARPPSVEAKPAHLLSILEKMVDELAAPTYDVTHYVGCTTCEHVAYAIQKVEKAHKTSLPELKKAISICRDIVAKFDELEALKKGKHAKLACTDLGFCIPEVETLGTTRVDAALKQVEAQVHKALAVPHGVKADILGCVMCQATGEVIVEVAKYSKDVVPLVKIGMETLCTRLPPEAKCSTVLTAFDELAQLIEVGSSPLQACVHVQLCDEIEKSAVVEKALQKVESTVSTWGKDDEVTCEMCEAVAATIMSIEKVNKQYLMAFKIGLEVLCDRFQTPQVIMPEFDHLVNLVEGGKNFLEACNEVKLCEAKQALHLPLLSSVDKVNAIESTVQSWLTVTPVSADKDVLTCVFCEYVGLVIAKVVTVDKSILPFLKPGFEILCAKLPVEAQCEKVVSKFDALVGLIEAGTAASQACGKVELCSVATPLPKAQLALPTTSHGFVQSQLGDLAIKMHAMEANRPKDMLTCLLCEDVAQLIKVVTNYDKDVVPLLKTGLEALCSQVQQLQAQCNSVVGKFDSLASLVESGTNPSEACLKTHLCEIAKQSTLDLEAHVTSWMASNRSVGSDEGCLFCQYASESIGAVIKVDKHQLPLVREAIGAMCSFLPPSVHCDDVNEHFEDLAKWLEGGSTALDVCHRIAVCQVAPTPDSTIVRVVIDDVVANQ
ncbi:hypothetical protein DYB32_006389 [Aphanomyces invadans]|uniref:Saposin B-type domain-containing protein n=1 Tax=Aphanomyces invadans TaxID=157072 RepID=A0A418AT55_9STRA|nr:hypothetical protein DYB32_006389 [Aphanomyces invadans]